MSDMARAPAGFGPVAMGGSFVTINGPLYVSDRGDRVGLRVERRHCNSLGFCHGGLLATFADMLMPVVMYHERHPVTSEHFLPTVSLQLDFLAPVAMGSWLEGEGHVLRTTRSLVFVQGLIRADGRAVARCSGVYKIADRIPAGSPGMYIESAPETSPSLK